MTVQPEALRELSAELVDAVTEAVAVPADPLARALAIRQLVDHMGEAVAWRHEFEPYETERLSLLELVAAADAHVRRMTATPGA